MAQQHAGSVLLGYEYLNAQGSNETRSSLQGWQAEVELNVTKKLGVFVDTANFYNAPVNVHSYTGGLHYKFFHMGRSTIGGFTELGDARTSKSGVTHAFEFIVGGGYTVKLSNFVSLNFIPGEYVLTVPNGNIRNNYTAAVGFVFPFGHR